MKQGIIYRTTLAATLITLMLTGCSKFLDKKPVTQSESSNATDSAVSAAGAEAYLQGVYGYFKGSGYGPGIEFNVLDRITNGDVLSDNCYAGGDNPDNAAIDLFTFNALNGNIARDWSDCYFVISKINEAIAQVSSSKDPALSAARKSRIIGEMSFIRAFQYFDAIRLWGNIPLVLTPIDATSSESLIKTSGGLPAPPDSVYAAILNDCWTAYATVGNVGEDPSKFVVSKGAVASLLAKVYATKAPAAWDSVAFYCDQVIPHYTLMTKFADLWDINHENNSESIWEIQYDGYSSSVGNWVPSNFEGAGWKKFSTPTNDLVNAYIAEHDSIRYHNTITIVDYGWPDKYWTDPGKYPVLSKYTDPNNGYNNMYMFRLADILLLRAEAFTAKGDIPSAAGLVNQVRHRAGLGDTPAGNQADMALAIEKERRLELAFEGQRWFDLVRTGRAIAVMNALKDGSGQNLNYNVKDYQLVYPVPQTQLDLNPLLQQNPGY